jgi:uncharacterized membrane protein
MSTLGWVHTIFSLVALAAGAAVILLRKGTRWHRTLGHLYLTSMLALNATALSIYRLFDGFGPFHWMAIASLITLVAGMVPVLARWPRQRWLALHGGCMSGSYVGLVAAAASEVTSRLGSDFGGTVAITTVVVIGVGMAILMRTLPQALGRVPRAPSR